MSETIALKRAQAALDEIAKAARGEWPQPLDLEYLAEAEPQPPRFIIPDWLPAGYATLLAGHGGIGKSAIALFLAVCIALGLYFCGLPVVRQRILYLSCEDRAAVLHWRLTRICRHLGVDMAALHGWLSILDLVGHDALLWAPDARTGAAITPGLAMLSERMEQAQAEVLVVDGVADVFGGNENSRSDVKQFVNALVGLVPAESGAVLLLGHVAKAASTAGAAGDGYSGSTGWHNSVRERWYLYPESAAGDDEGIERGSLKLELQKSNLGGVGQALRFRWDEAAHLFVGEQVAGATALDLKLRDKDEQHGILAALSGCESASIIVPAAMTGQRTAFHVLSQRPEMPDSLRQGTPAKRRFWRQIEALRQMGFVEEASYRRKCGHLGAQFSLTTEGKRRIGEWQ